MQLSLLVEYLSLLESCSRDDLTKAVKQQIDPVSYLIRNHSVQIDDLLLSMDQNIADINASLDDFVQTIDQIKHRTRELISGLEPRYFAESYRLYDQEMRNDSAEYVLNRRLDISGEALQFIQARITAGSDWHHAGMIIRPGIENWIETLVSLDPLYIVDQSHDLLAPVKSKFNENYQKRLRYYVIDESTSRPLSALPDDQFSYCLAFNFFHYKPFEIIKTYLTDIYLKLAPGGTLAFTFNDCDRVGGVRLAERSFMCYTPGGLLRSLAVSLGYSVRQTYHVDGAITWLELHKSGRLHSLKGGQTLARIRSK